MATNVMAWSRRSVDGSPESLPLDCQPASEAQRERHHVYGASIVPIPSPVSTDSYCWQTRTHRPVTSRVGPEPFHSLPLALRRCPALAEVTVSEPSPTRCLTVSATVPTRHFERQPRTQSSWSSSGWLSTISWANKRGTAATSSIASAAARTALRRVTAKPSVRCAT